MEGGWLQIIACMLIVAPFAYQLGWRRTIALSTALDQAFAWPVAYAMWPDRYFASCHWPVWCVLLPGWVGVAWLLNRRGIPDEWLPTRGLYGRKLLAGLALAALGAGNPLVAPFFTMRERELQKFLNEGTLLAVIVAVLLHYPLWQVLVYGWHRRERWRISELAANATAPAPPAGTAHRR